MATHTINEGSYASSGTASSNALPPQLTFHDAMQHLLDFGQAYGKMSSKPTLRRAILRAYEEISQTFGWNFLHDIYRIQAHAEQTDGTVAYDHDTYTLTLTDDTWPDWATKEYGAAVLLDDVVCDVELRTSTTTLTLSTVRNPGADVSSGTSYKLFPRWYPLPDDYLELDHPLSETLYNFGEQVSLADLAARHRYETTSGEFRCWAVGPDPNGGMALHVYPALDTAVRIDVPYKARPRDLKLDGLNSNHYAGTVSTSGSTVTGSGTTFSSDMEGSILRLREDSTVPTGIDGDNPYSEEHRIRTWTSTTAMTTETTMSTLSGVAYIVSDPIALERFTWDAFLQCAEKHLARMRNYDDYRQIERESQMAMNRAKIANHTASPARVIGGQTRYVRLKDRVASE